MLIYYASSKSRYLNCKANWSFECYLICIQVEWRIQISVIYTCEISWKQLDLLWLYKLGIYNWAICYVCREIIVKKVNCLSKLISLLLDILETWWGFDCCLLALLGYLECYWLNWVSTGWIRGYYFYIEIESKYRTAYNVQISWTLIKLYL